MGRVRFVGGADDELREFPDDARREMGYQLYRVEIGREPSDWKPMATVGKGVREIRVRTETGAYRTIYTASLGEHIYVLHCFTKKTQKTPRSDIDIAKRRLSQAISDVERERREKP